MTAGLFDPAIVTGPGLASVRYPATRYRVLFDSGVAVDVVAGERDDSTLRRLILETWPGNGGIAGMVALESVGWYDWTPTGDYDHADHSPDQT